PDDLQRGDGGFDDLATRLAVDGSHQADATGIVLLGRIVETVRCQMRRIRLPARDLVSTGSRAIFGMAVFKSVVSAARHAASPWTSAGRQVIGTCFGSAATRSIQRRMAG